MTLRGYRIYAFSFLICGFNVFGSALFTALNNGLSNYRGCMLLTSHDQELMNTVANRIIEIEETKVYDRQVSYDEYVDEIN